MKDLENTKFHKRIWEEEIINFNGKKVIRIKTSVLYIFGLLALIFGITLVNLNYSQGLILIFTVCPLFFLYPTIRFLFGGKDSLFAFLTTIIFSEYLKYLLKKKNDKKKNGK